MSWSIFNEECDKCTDDLLEIIEKQLDYLLIDERDRHNETNFLCIAQIIFILSVYEKIEVDQFDDIVLQSLKMARGYEITKNDRGFFSGNNLLLSCVLLGEIVNNIQTDGKRAVDKNALTMIIETIFDNRDGLGRAEINGKYVERFLLSAVISLEKQLPKDVQTLVVDCIAYGAQETTTLVSLDIWWHYLIEKRAYERLKVIFDKWLNVENGSAWKCELYELHSIAEQLIPLSRGLGWDHEILKVETILNNAQVGYVGRKDYSLYRPLEWYKSLDSKNVSWIKLGLLFLNISHYASETGDNRAAVQIENAVASTVGCSGAKDINAFMNIVSPGSWNEFTIILDALIASFSTEQFNEDEVLCIWETVVGLAEIDHSLPEYNSDNSHKIIYIVDLRIAIETYIHCNSFNVEIIEKLRGIAPFEYELHYGPESVTFILPDRWYDKPHSNKAADDFVSKIKGLSCQAAFDKLTEIVRQRLRQDIP